MKILVIDDAADARLYVSLLLRRWGYEVLEAEDGHAGLDLLLAQDIRLVICDWMMPGMSGPELCRAVRTANLSHYAYIILLTGRSDSADLVEGLNAGADDFVTKPFEAQVLRARLRVGERILALEQRLGEQNRDLLESRNQLAQAYDQIQADLATAARIQRQLLPTSDQATSPFRAHWLFLPAAQVSGDSFNFFELTPGLVGFYHLDISGHGVPAALLSVSLSRSLVPGGGPGTVATDFFDPATFLADLNRQFTSRDGEVENYATIAYGTLEKHTGRVRLALAAHPYPLVLRQSGRIDTLQQGGLPVGMFPEVDYRAQ
ncbi:MAG: response regulator, partial [Gammaproteobacteria bacterium]|nr:response regulator [Gammaproteobacteria bacterium]